MALPQHIYAVILAGGSGTRFWPKSRQRFPKQLCQIGDSDCSMLAMTLKRLDGFIPPERRIVVTHVKQIEQTRTDVGDLCRTFLAEPIAQNTAPALAMAAIEISKMNKIDVEPVMISLHADAIISDTPAFLQSLSDAVRVAEAGYLTLLGIKPTYPETGYGYIEIGAKLSTPGFRVVSFKEKPSLELAKKYFQDERLFWNSGIFVWKTSVLLNELAAHEPAIPDLLNGVVRQYRSFNEVPESALSETYHQVPKIAIDNAILEVSSEVAMVATRFGWQDVGSWDALSQTFPTDKDGNLVYGDAIALETKNTTIDTDGPLVATLGLSDMVVVAAKGAVLVCPKSRSQEVKKIVEELERRGRKEFL